MASTGIRGTRRRLASCLAVVLAAACVAPKPEPVPTTPPDGGADPYAGALPPDRVPVGVWFESVLAQGDVAKDRGAGVNTYVELTANSSPAVVRANADMRMVHGNASWGSANADAWLITDEADMWAGPGWDSWTGNLPGRGPVCEPDAGRCGYTVMESLARTFPADGKPRYANYGKGVVFWESDEQAAVFVNRFQQVTSADIYWFTDPSVCVSASEGPALIPGLTEATCRRAYNYGIVTEQMRRLVSPAGSRPIWSFIELAGPFTENGAVASFIQPREIDAAVWHSLIAGARGILYFNHTFGVPAAGEPDCRSQHVLREDAVTACGYDRVRAQVTATNAKVQQVARAVNGRFVDFNGSAAGALTTSGAVTASPRWDGASLWLLAGSTRGRGQGSTAATFTMPCVGDATATVVGEGRAVPVVGGMLSDTFADELTTHVYRIDGAGSCALS